MHSEGETFPANYAFTGYDFEVHDIFYIKNASSYGFIIVPKILCLIVPLRILKSCNVQCVIIFCNKKR